MVKINIETNLTSLHMDYIFLTYESQYMVKEDCVNSANVAIFVERRK